MKPFSAFCIAVQLLFAFLVAGCRPHTDAPLQPLPELSGPEELVAESITRTSAVIRWQAPRNMHNVIGYNLSSAGSVLTTIEKSATSYFITDLQPGMDYTFMLQALYNDGMKSEAAVVGIRTQKLPNPVSPKHFRARQIRSTEIDLTWESSADRDNSDFECYVLLYGRNRITIDKRETTYTATGLKPATPCTFMLTARTTDGRESNTAAFTTTTLP